MEEMVVRCLSYVLLLLLATRGIRSEDYPFRNTSLPIEERVENLVSLLSVSEMVDQMAHGGANNNGPAPAIKRLGINPYQWGTECISGDVWAGNATSFPMSIGLAATFDYDLVYDFAKATSDELRAKNSDAVAHGSYDFHTGLSCWSPVINIMRDPRWGRNQETYGEDPWLSGLLAKAYITGLQGNDPRYVEANAGCKHFDAYGGPENIPVSRLSFSANVTMRDWRMTYLPQFKACVDAGAWSFMCSYNSINGTPACAHKQLLSDILRKEWGFKGYVISDQGALEYMISGHHYKDTYVETAAAAVNAGTCLEDGDSYNNNVFDTLVDAINKSLVSKDRIGECVSQLFTVRMKLGEFDPPDNNPYLNFSLDVIQSEAHRKLSLKAVLESIVLLKNDPVNGLPMRSSVQSLCIVGPFIDQPQLLFGFYSPTPMEEYVVTPLQGILKLKNMSVTSNPACTDGPECLDYDRKSTVSSCSRADMIIATIGLGTSLESEGNDRSNLSLPGNQLQMLQDLASAYSQTPMVVVMFNACPLDISWAVRSPQVVAILEMFYPAQAAGDALTMVLTNEYNPAGRLPSTWPASLDQVPPITNYAMTGRTYRYWNPKMVPLFPFGYGLSYTTFDYTSLKTPVIVIRAGSNLSAIVMVSNTGRVDGDEVTQLYLHWTDPSIPAPVRQLVGVARTHIVAGQSATLNFIVTSEQMQVWTTKWEIIPGRMQLTVGGQQPGQSVAVSSNVLSVFFTITA